MRIWIARLNISNAEKVLVTDVDAFYNLSDAVEYYRDIYSEYVEAWYDEFEDVHGLPVTYICFKDTHKNYNKMIDIWFKPVTLDWSHKKPRLKPNVED